jgi:hypothetical protein
MATTADGSTYDAKPTQGKGDFDMKIALAFVVASCLLAAALTAAVATRGTFRPVERQLRVDHEIAGVAVADLRLATISRPLHRSTHTPGRPRDERILRIAGIPGAIAAADVAGDDADGFRRHAEDDRDVAANPPRPA